MPPGYAAAPYGYAQAVADSERAKQVDRTKTGILLILVGTLLSWVPYLIDLIGYLLIFFGLILIILGRKAFGGSHARNVILSIVLLFVGIGAVFGAALPLGFSVATAQLTGTPPTAAELTSDMQILLIGEVFGAVAFGLMSVLFTYALQRQTGRVLLFSGFGASVALSVAIYLLVAPLIQGAIQSALAGGTFDSATVSALEGVATGYALLNAIPSQLFAAAEYLAWSRISRREIPATPPPGMPPYAAPGYPPAVPPQTPPTPPQGPPLNPPP